ncbi:MAG: glutamine--fructose-6-phosphate transaminase (isomerizing) [Clostridia bacterium]|nr:glutamine--fructose-6-phosphate transaminase (isomerizing) [Clostridia bacterium]
MCGIVCYIGKKPEKILIEKLKRLEYRGYDSAGIAVKSDKGFDIFKAKGEIKNLESKVKEIDNSYLGIGHTRWATHGKPDEANAHPHISTDKKWVIVHNGIIENYSSLRDKLIGFGYEFYSETDTEIIAKLLQYYDNGNALETIRQTISVLKGSFALGIMKQDVDGIFFAKSKSPLFISKNEENVMVASDIICFKNFGDTFYQLSDGVFGFASSKKIEFYDKFGSVNIKEEKLDLNEMDDENKYEHFMLKEIYETKPAIKNISEFYSKQRLLEIFENLNVKNIRKIKLVGCGTAYHAALMGADMIEKATDIDCEVVVASEFRYSEPRIGEDTIVILISQSGETADTLAAFELAKQKGAITIGIINIEYSALAKKVDYLLPIKAGVEVAVASTKAYSAQLLVLYLLSQALGNKVKNSEIDLSTVKTLINDFDYGTTKELQDLAEYLRYNDKLFMIGRGKDYFTALEASLKIKETSYINSDTYYAGELKHGFLALIEEDTFVIVFATDKKLIDKTISNAEEARARGAKIILFTPFDIDKGITDKFFKVFKVKKTDDRLQCIENITMWQLIAYYISVNKGINPDKPRNLAKSVTVE